MQHHQQQQQQQHQQHQHQHEQRGVTLIESLVVMVITAVILSVALPSFESARARRHLDGMAAQLETELQFARSLAVARNETVRIGFEAKGATSCVIIHSGSPGDCVCGVGGPAVCKADAQEIRTTRLDALSPVSVHSNSRSIGFSPHFGTVTPTATMEVANRRGEVVRLVVNVMGRVRSCTPSAGLQGYRRC